MESFQLTFADDKFSDFSENVDCPHQQERLTISSCDWLRLAPAPWDANEAPPSRPADSLLLCGLIPFSTAQQKTKRRVGGVHSTHCPGTTLATVPPKSAGISVFCHYANAQGHYNTQCTHEEGCVMNMNSQSTYNLISGPCGCMCSRGVTHTQTPRCFQAPGAGEKRLPNFPSRSTRLHMQMLITTGACMGQSAGWWNSLCILLPPPPPTGRRFHSYSPGW